MANLKIPALPGTIILVIIAITAGAFVWLYERGQDDMKNVSDQTFGSFLSTFKFLK